MWSTNSLTTWPPCTASYAALCENVLYTKDASLHILQQDMDNLNIHMTQHRNGCQIIGLWVNKMGSVTTLDVQARRLHNIKIHHFIIRNIFESGYSRILLFGNVVFREHVSFLTLYWREKYLHIQDTWHMTQDLLWTMSPRFEGNPFTHWKQLWLNCPHLTLTEAFRSWKMGQAEQIRTNPNKGSKIKLCLLWHGMQVCEPRTQL